MVKEERIPTFADIANKRRMKNDFLSKIKVSVDWRRFNSIFQKRHRNRLVSLGAPAYSPLLMFKILLLQQWYGLSDPRMEVEMYKRIDFMDFLELSTESEVPDHSTISRFRTFLVENGLEYKLFNEINKQLKKKRIIVKDGVASVDATLVESSRRARRVYNSEIVEESDKNDDENNMSDTSTRNDDENNEPDTDTQDETNEKEVKKKQIKINTKLKYSDDEKSKFAVKGGKTTYGYKVHNAVDKNGYILGGHVTGANISDTTELKKIIEKINLKEGAEVLADKGYSSQKNREMLKENKLKDGIMSRGSRGHPITEEEKERNRKITKYRYVVEQYFGTLKRVYGFVRMKQRAKEMYARISAKEHSI